MSPNKLTLTKEQEKKLRSFLPITFTAELEFTPKEYNELPENMRPKFTVRPLDGEGQAAIDNVNSQMGDQSLTGLKYGWKKVFWPAFGWSKDGKAVNVDDNIINMTPSGLRWVLFGKIMEITNLNEDERRGLDS